MDRQRSKGRPMLLAALPGWRAHLEVAAQIRGTNFRNRATDCLRAEELNVAKHLAIGSYYSVIRGRYRGLTGIAGCWICCDVGMAHPEGPGCTSLWFPTVASDYVSFHGSLNTLRKATPLEELKVRRVQMEN
jgi:hypothetical protein